MKIPRGSTKSAFSIISNGRRTDWKPNNNFLPLMDKHKIKRSSIQMRITKSNSHDMPPDDKPTTRWPAFDWHPETRLTMDTEPLHKNDKWDPFGNQFKIENDLFKPAESNNFKPYMPPPPPPPRLTGALAFRAFGGIVMGVLALILLVKACGRKGRTRRGVVLAPGAVVVAGPVQQDIQTDRTPPGHGGFPRVATCQPSGPEPPQFDLPPSYSECINKNVSEQPQRYTNRADTEPLLHNGLVEIRNDCVAMTTTPDDAEDVKAKSVFDNGRIVERLSLNLKKETGQGTHEARVLHI